MHKLATTNQSLPSKERKVVVSRIRTLGPKNTRIMTHMGHLHPAHLQLYHFLPWAACHDEIAQSMSRCFWKDPTRISFNL